jgi:hypothetical protein
LPELFAMGKCKTCDGCFRRIAPKDYSDYAIRYTRQ